MKRLLLIAAIALPALAQTTIKDALVKHWKTTGDFTLAVAKAMPAESYGYKQVPEEMSFSQVLVQVAGADMNACSNASGMPRPAVPPKISENMKAEKDTDKEMVVQFLADTFSFCNQAVASMTPEKL